MPKSPDPIAPLGTVVSYTLSADDLTAIISAHCNSFGLVAGGTARAVVDAVESGDRRSLRIYSTGSTQPVAWFGGRAQGAEPGQWRTV